MDSFLVLGTFFVTLVVPFLYSRMTTENFLTPKEFTSKMAMGILLALFCGRTIALGKFSLRRTSLDLPLTLFIFWWVLSIAWNYNVPSAIRDLRGCLLILFLFPLIVNTIRFRWQFDLILWAMVLAGVATSLLGMMEAYNLYFRCDPQAGWMFVRDEVLASPTPIIFHEQDYLPLFPQLANRDYSMEAIVSTFGNRNYLGTFSMFTAFIPLAFCFYYRNLFLKAASFLSLGIMAYGLLITRCRAAAIGIASGFCFMILMLFLLNKRFFRKNAPFFAVVCLVGFGIVFLTTQTTSFSIVDKIKKTVSLNRENSNTNERLWVWYSTYKSFSDNPIKWVLGSGFGSYKHFFPFQEADTLSDENKETFTSVTFRQAHNDWLQLVSELGLIGLAIFVWLVWRFFSGIYIAIKTDAKKADSGGGFSADHVLLIALGAAMVSQLVAGLPDFPFHRIETALYIVIAMALVPLFGETQFLRKELENRKIGGNEHALPLCIIGIVAGLMAFQFERVCWNADTLVRGADMRVQSRNPQLIGEAKKMLIHAISSDNLPGDPYLKLATIAELEGKGKEALDWCEKSMKNINFNARSTYHSVVFRLMHIYYHLLGDRENGLKYAEQGQHLTYGDARSIYYYYIGRIALDLQTVDPKKFLDKAAWAFQRACNYEKFAPQAGANLAVVLATQQKWEEALRWAASISSLVGNTDPTLLDVIGISASNLGQFATAEQALRVAVALNEDQPVYKRDLGIALLRMNRGDEAQSFLEKAYTASNVPENVKAEVESLLASITLYHRDLGKKLLSAQKTSEAVVHLKKAYEAKVIPKEMKEEIGSIFKSMNLFQAEKGPLPPEAYSTPERAPNVPTSAPSELR